MGVEKKYFYNAKTHRLHIKGCCRFSESLPYNTVFFDTYDDALAYDGRSVGLCKICKKKADGEHRQ
ncbi:MAG: hypothetical protein IJO45_05255 [Oscillospiraceae bacterium]|nr:hypothetical protein [Oscillospiraceae bacterium]